MPKPGNERSAVFKARRGKAWAGTKAPFSQRSFCFGCGRSENMGLFPAIDEMRLSSDVKSVERPEPTT